VTSTRTEIPTSTGLQRGWLGWFTSTGLAARPRGQLELWNQDGTRGEKGIQPLSIEPLFFEIEDRNFHAVRLSFPVLALRVSHLLLIFIRWVGNCTHNSV
jgi:hypothetical protein